MEDLGFINDIIAHPDDPVPRLVYADWLDERDDPRGEFLRLELQVRALAEEDQREDLRGRLKELREAIDPGWLAQLDRTAIENCTVHFEFECPQRWENLRTTGKETVRLCDSCHKAVYFCESVAEAREKAWQGECVAVDSRLARTPGDLDPPREYMTLGILLPDFNPPAALPGRVEAEERRGQSGRGRRTRKRRSEQRRGE